MSELINIQIERDSSDLPTRLRVQFSVIPVYFMFRTYDALGPRPLKISELERQAQEDIGRFISREIHKAIQELEQELLEKRE